MSAVLRRLRLPRDDSVIEGTNKDLLPTPVHERTWRWWKYVATWAGPSFDVNQWNTGSSFITVGLTITQTTAPVLIGCAIATLGLVLMGIPGSRYHVGFPSLVRPTYGTSAVKFIVGLRGLVCVIWYAIEVYYASNMVSICFRCFSNSWYTWDPSVPASAGTTAQTLISYHVTWLMILPLAFVHPRRLDSLFVARSIVGPVCYIAFFAWCASLGYKTPGGFQGLSNVESTTSLTGGTLGWAIVSAVNSIMGTISPQMTNVSDITRYARSPRDVGWQQGVGFFVTKVISVFLAIFSASFLYSRYGGTVLWNVWDQMDLVLTENWSGANRFGIFVLAAGFAFSSVTTNAYANTVPFGADVSALLPAYFDMRRGQVAIALISLCVLPWRLFTSGAKFLNFLGSYSFFMASVVGPFFVDYFIVRRGNYHTPSFYRHDPTDIYTNNRFGAGWRGLLAFCCGIVMVIPGLVASYIPAQATGTAAKMYSTGWVLSAVTSATVYYVLCKIWPVRILPDGNEELAKTLRFEQLSETEGFLPDEGAQHEYGAGSDEYGDDEKKVGEVVSVREL